MSEPQKQLVDGVEFFAVKNDSEPFHWITETENTVTVVPPVDLTPSTRNIWTVASPTHRHLDDGIMYLSGHDAEARSFHLAASFAKLKPSSHKYIVS